LMATYISLALRFLACVVKVGGGSVGPWARRTWIDVGCRSEILATVSRNPPQPRLAAPPRTHRRRHPPRRRTNAEVPAMPIRCAPSPAAHLPPAAALLAARFRRVCAAVPHFGSPLIDGETAYGLLSETFQAPWATGVAALRDGQLVGYLLATPRPVIP